MTRAETRDSIIESGRLLAVQVSRGVATDRLRPMADAYLAAHAEWMSPKIGQRIPLPPVDDPRLSKRERQIVSMAIQGHGYVSIARKLGIVPGTVKVHLRVARLKVKELAR